MPFDVQGARKAGYSNREIADYLASQKKFDTTGARKAGYSDEDIISHLATYEPKKAEAYTGPTTFEAKVAPEAKEEPGIVDRVTGAIREFVSGPGSVMDKAPAGKPAPDQRLELGQGPISEATLRKARDIREGVARPEDQSAVVQRTAEALAAKKEPTLRGLVDQAMEPERIAEQAEAQRKKEQDRRNPTLASISDYSKYYAGSIAGGTLAIPLGLEMGAEGAIRNVVSGEAFDATPVGKVFNLARSAFNDVLGIQSIQEQVKDKRAAQITVDRAMSSLPSIPGVQELATYGNSVRKDLQESVSEKSKSRLADTEITGNIFKGELNFGKNPNLYGYALQAAGVLGSLAPTIVTAIATRGNTAALGTVGFGMTAAEGADTAKEYLGKLTDEQLLEASPYYKAMVDRGVPVKEARQIVTDKAAENAAMLQGMIGAVGGRITGKLVTGAYDDILSRIGGKSLVGRVAAGTVGSGLEEGVQEVTEGLGADIGIRSQVTSKEIGEGSAANLILGALGGAGPGGVRGAVSKTPEQQIAQQIDAGVAQAQPAGVNEAAIRALNPETYDQTIVTPQQTVNRSAQIDALSQATSVDEAVNAAMNLAGTVEGGATYAPSQAPAAATPLAGATPTFGGLPIAPAVGAVTPQAELVTPTPELVTPEVTPVTAAVTPEVTPVTTTEDRGVLPTLAPRPQRIQGKAVADLSDDDLRAVVENDAAPAITRRGAQIELDARAKEVEATTPEVAATTIPSARAGSEAVLATTPEVAATAPRVDSIDRLPVGPGSIKPRVIAEDKPLYRETNTDGIAGLLREDKQFTPENMFVTDNKDIALGQGKNKGVLVEFRPNSLSGEENVKPMTGELAGREYKADISAPRAVQSITFTDPKELKAVRGLTGRTLMQEFDRSINDAGQTVFTRKPQTPTPEVSRETTESFIDIPADTGTTALPNADAEPVGGVAAADRARAIAQEAVNRWAASENRTDGPVLNPAPAQENAEVNQIANALNSQFGAKLYAYHDARPTAANGFALGGTAFINTASPTVNVLRTSLHEFKHRVEQIAEAERRQGLTNTPAQQFTASIDSIFTDMTEEGKRAYSENFLHKEELDAITDPAEREQRLQELLQAPLLMSEMTADFLGNRATDKAFFRDVARADPEGFKAFVEKWIGIIDNLLATLRGTATQKKGESAKVDQYTRDLKKAKMVAREALIAYRRGTLQQTPAEAGTPAMSLREGEGREADIPGRGEGVQPSPERAGPAAGEDGRSDLPSYGEARDGAISVVGRHYSPRVQTSLSSAYYGTGLRGAEAGRLRESKDSRIGNRIYFYVDTGNGIRPESGVGRFAHEVQLNNIYDPATRLIPPQPNSNAFESAVIDAGFDGYIAPFGRGAAVVMLGPKHDYVPVKSLEAPAFAKKQKTTAIGDYETIPQKDGGIMVQGDVEAIRGIMPEGVVGRPVEGGVMFTPANAPRVRAALEGRKLAYSRAGAVLEKLPMKDGKYVGAPPKYNTPGKIAALRKNLRKLTMEGAPGRYWYENSSRAILRMTGGNVEEARKFVALLAIYSPQAKVDANSTFALRAWAQYKAGQPISVKTGVMDAKAKAAMDDVDAYWSGEKTGNFFNNLLREIDPSTAGKQGATIDMWMMRAAEYPTDAPNPNQYSFMENETNAIAKEMGWEPQQVQAAIWVAMKARMENPGVKKRTEESSEKNGWIRYDYPLKNGKPTKTRVILDAQAHRDNWLSKAFAHDPTKDDTQAAKFDFEDGVMRHLGQLSFEARPGRSTGVLPGIHDAPYVQQVEFQQAVQAAFLEPDGSDRLAQLLGLLVDTQNILAPGVWQGDVSPSSQKLVAMAPAKGEEGKTSVDPAQAEALNLYAAMAGLVAKQEGVGWHRPFYAATKRDANALDINLGRVINPTEAADLERAIGVWMENNDKAGWQNDFAIISSPAGVRLVNFGIIPNSTLQSEIVKVAESALPDFDYRAFASSGDMPTNNWKENPNGESYVQRFSAAGRSDVLDWARTVLAPRVQSVFNEYSKKYDWGDPGKISFSTRQRGGEAARETPQVTPAGLESLFEGLNGRGLKRTRAQAAVNARPDAARLNYVQENFIDILSELEDSGKVKINCD
jgi:hypothetical protein